MVGGCGVIGGENRSIARMAEHLATTGAERVSNYEDSNVRIASLTHPHRERENPGRASTGDVLVWVWGNVLGSRRDGSYQPRGPDDEPAPVYCAALYEEYGPEFASRLNGDFVGIVYDRDRSTVSVFTDRLGSWPLYVTEADDGAVVFSSHIQSLAAYPGLSLTFDESYVVQHLSWRGGPYGVKTPLSGVESFPPGTVTTYDLSDGSVTRNRYWKPSLTADRFSDYEAFVDQFVAAFRASVAERTRDRSKRYGLLLSGGSDARLILGAIDEDVDLVAYHMGDWMSKEARVAERIAMERGIEFRFLRRDPEYFGRVLERSPKFWNFQQLFNQAWAEGFIDEIRSEVDVLFTGHFADTMFKGSFVPARYVDLGPLGNQRTPVRLPIDDLEAFDEELGPSKPPFVRSDVDLSEVLRQNITVTDGRVESYGVEFDSFEEFVLGFPHVPASTDSLFRQSLREHVELQMPLFDTRIIDLWEGMPRRWELERNVINSAVVAIAPDLAAIPHASSGLSLHRSRLTHQLGQIPMNALRRLSPFDAVPAGPVSHQPWGNHGALARSQSYVGDAIHGAEEVVRALPFLDWDRVLECYEEHLDGEDNTKYLHRLVTFLEAPLTRQLAAEYAGRAGDETATAVATADQRPAQ